LDDVSFEIKQGDAVGIIGRNGAGKSTLLKILSRITRPTRGKAELFGRVGSLLEVGTGFHTELTGRENVYLNGAILGMGRREIERKFDEIVDFSGVEKFLDTPVKFYSSGMYVRLAFAVAAHLEPEILVVDEVLAVGDAEFQKKCLGKMGEVTDAGRTVLFVSHNMAAIENLCRTGIVLNQGKVSFIGSQSEAISEYQRRSSLKSGTLGDRKDRHGSGEIRVTGIEFRDLEGRAIDSITSGQDFDIVFSYSALPGFHSNRVIASFAIRTQWDTPVSLNHNRMTGDSFGVLPEKGSFVCRINRINLTSSVYRLTYSISIDAKTIDSITDAIELNIVAGDYFGSGEIPPNSHGYCILDSRWRLEK
jgi:lipopolysaccharide transport system ATP-binding protein